MFHISSLRKARGTEGGQGASSQLGDEQSKNNFRCSLFLKEVYLWFFRNFASPSDFQSEETPVQQQTCKIRLNRSLYVHVLAGFWSHDWPTERCLCSKQTPITIYRCGAKYGPGRRRSWRVFLLSIRHFHRSPRPVVYGETGTE